MVVGYSLRRLQNKFRITNHKMIYKNYNLQNPEKKIKNKNGTIYI